MEGVPHLRITNEIRRKISGIGRKRSDCKPQIQDRMSLGERLFPGLDVTLQNACRKIHQQRQTKPD